MNEPEYLITANALVYREGLEKIKGFNPQIRIAAGEDIDLGIKLRKLGKLTYCEEAIVMHDFEENLDGFSVQKNLHFYENIGKYNQFFMGWDDALFTNEELVLIDNKMNIGSSIENYIISAWSVDLTEPWNPDTTTVIITDEFNYNKNNGELSLTGELNSGLENLQVTFTKASIFDTF